MKVVINGISYFIDFDFITEIKVNDDQTVTLYYDEISFDYPFRAEQFSPVLKAYKKHTQELVK